MIDPDYQGFGLLAYYVGLLTGFGFYELGWPVGFGILAGWLGSAALFAVLLAVVDDRTDRPAKAPASDEGDCP